MTATRSKRPALTYNEGYQWGVKYGAAVKRGFMCKIDFDHEIGAAMGGNKVYPSEKDLRREHSMAGQCGIVEVEIKLVRVVAFETPPAKRKQKMKR